ncbi:MAG: hypothetical protein ABGY10_14260, partial [bacterium]
MATIRRICLLGLISALTVCSQTNQGRDNTPVETEHNKLTTEEVAAGWLLLFDGVSTDGWRGYL